MKRLTKRTTSGIAVPNGTDICQLISSNLCEHYDFCSGCPVGKMLDRLCTYEDTGLTPEQFLNIKKLANIRKRYRKGITGIPKSGAKVLFQRVSGNGIIINGVLYGIPILVNDHQGEKVKIRIVDDIATVYDIETGDQIVWFELFLH